MLDIGSLDLGATAFSAVIFSIGKAIQAGYGIQDRGLKGSQRFGAILGLESIHIYFLFLSAILFDIFIFMTGGISESITCYFLTIFCISY